MAQTPIAAVYGFICWVLTIILFLVFLVWSLVPDTMLLAVDVTYFPDKYWALAIPSFIVVTFLFYWTFYVSMYVKNILPLNDPRTIGPWPTCRVAVGPGVVTPTRKPPPPPNTTSTGNSTTNSTTTTSSTSGYINSFGTLSTHIGGTKASAIPPVMEIPLDV
eukprot:PhF_6_TR8942/c0_g1_i1/m.14092/K03861/PIGP, GPI19, DSCR5; phosphatidylinositol glycan, class P